MITEKILVFLVLVAVVPVAYTRYASLGGQLFPDDIILPKNQNNQANREIVDVSWKKVDLKDTDRVQDQRNPDIDLVDSDEDPESHESEDSEVQFVDHFKNEVNGTSYRVCRTAKCKELASEFRSSMNKSVNPCENFYDFACGGYEASNPIPPYRLHWSSFYKAHDLTRYRLKKILEAEIKQTDILPVKQAKEWYRSCMNTERLERIGIAPIEAIMMQVGGWPMAMDKDDWDENEISWQEVQSHYARLTGSYAFYDIGVPHVSRENISIIYLDAPKIALAGKSSYEDYQRLVSKVAGTFAKHYKASVSNKTLYRESENLVLFQKELSKLSRVNKATEIGSFEGVTVEEGSESEESVVDWTLEIQELFDLANIQVQPSTHFMIKNMGYFEGIEQLLQRTPKRTIVNYIHWMFLAKVLAFTNDEMRYEFSNRKRMKEYFKLKESEPRWSECVDEMKMSHAASYAFVKKYFPRKTRKAAEKMIDNVRIALEQNIENSNWLDAKSKDLSKEKLRSMRIFVGAPEWYSKSAITKYYKGITIGADYLENNLNYMRYEVEQNLKLYVQPRPTIDPFMQTVGLPTDANAFYVKSFNYAEFPATDFEYPFFGMDWPNYVNYGKVGFLIGHEMGHAFDNCGITHDKDGDETQLDKMILRSFYERVDCFVNQFDTYHGTKQSVNGTDWNCDNQNEKYKTKGQKTAGENMADTTGLQALFGAYKRNMKKNPNGDMRLPGFEEYTDDQLFFLSFAVSWCDASTPEFAKYKKKYSTDVHSGPEHRVNGAVSNTKEFARAFNCRAGTPMNPTNKCSVWEKPGARINRETRHINHHSWDQQWDD